MSGRPNFMPNSERTIVPLATDAIARPLAEGSVSTLTVSVIGLLTPSIVRLPLTRAVGVELFDLRRDKAGAAPSGCAAGYRTQWQENFYLVANLPVQGSTTGDYALAREVGGNVATFSATGNWDYDVWYGSWNQSP